jgi:hypothetical protein
MRAPALLLVAFLASGCFVLDELDTAHKTMDELSGGPAPKAEAESAAGGSGEAEGSGLLARVQAWWTSQGAAAPSRSADDGPKRNPEDVPVRCEVDGRSVFTHKFDCLARGGRPAV